MTLLTDLADACRTSGLKVVELPGWARNVSGGSFDPAGVLCHHTGSYDALTDARDDRAYAEWLAFTGRPDLPAPLCNLALSAEGVVYVCSSGNANHAGEARRSGPMPPASDGNALYVGIEAMNSGTQGWDSVGEDAAGNPITQGEAYARLCAALCSFYGWQASHVRAHRETSVTGKWDPGKLDMNDHRAAVARLLRNGIPQEDDMPTVDDLWNADIPEYDPDSKKDSRRARVLLAQAHARAGEALDHVRKLERKVDDLLELVKTLAGAK